MTPSFRALAASGIAIVLAAPAQAAVALAPPSAGEVAPAPAPGAAVAARAPLQIGYARALPALATVDGVRRELEWKPRASGAQAAIVRVRSAGAAAVRVGMRIGSLPEGATLRFHAPDGEAAFEVPAARVRRALTRNRHAGDMDGEGRTYWSPIVEGEALVIEIEVPRGAARADVRVTVPMLSHFVVAPAAALAGPRSGIVYTREGTSFACAGTLVAPGVGDVATPYFLTSHRCIGSQSAASSLQPYWIDRGSPRGFRTIAGGATLLHGAAATDTAFVELDATPPRGLRRARWPGPETAAFVAADDPALEQWLAGGAARAVLTSAAAR